MDSRMNGIPILQGNRDVGGVPSSLHTSRCLVRVGKIGTLMLISKVVMSRWALSGNPPQLALSMWNLLKCQQFFLSFASLMFWFVWGSLMLMPGLSDWYGMGHKWPQWGLIAEKDSISTRVKHIKFTRIGHQLHDCYMQNGMMIAVSLRVRRPLMAGSHFLCKLARIMEHTQSRRLNSPSLSCHGAAPRSGSHAVPEPSRSKSVDLHKSSQIQVTCAMFDRGKQGE